MAMIQCDQQVSVYQRKEKQEQLQLREGNNKAVQQITTTDLYPFVIERMSETVNLAKSVTLLQ